MSGSALVGAKAMLNLSAATQVTAATSGMRIGRVSVTTAGTLPGAIYDAATVGGIGAPTLVATIPNAVGQYLVDFPCVNGIIFVPGTGMTASVTYD